MKFILGKKVGMTQVWKDEEVVPVTKIQAGPCVITQVKTKDRDGYDAVQIGFGEKKDKNVKKPQKGHLKDFSKKPRYLREFRTAEQDVAELKVGAKIEAGTFEVGEKIDVTGISKGKGFQGVVKRHGFSGASKTHGTKDQERMPGSAGAMGVGRIFPGQKMPGRMGGDQTTVKSLEVVNVDTENNIIFVKGGVAGPNKGLVLLKSEGELKISRDEEKETPKEGASEKEGQEQEQAQEAAGAEEEAGAENKTDQAETEKEKEKEEDAAGEEKNQ